MCFFADRVQNVFLKSNENNFLNSNKIIIGKRVKNASSPGIKCNLI